MSFQTLERKIIAQARLAFNNPKLKLGHIKEWSSSEDTVKDNLLDGEVYTNLPGLGVSVCIAAENDKRETK